LGEGEVPPYSKPPITEAVIEFQFEGACPDKVRGKIARKLRKLYPIEEILQEILFQGSSTATSSRVTPIGVKLSSRDRDEIVTLTEAGMTPGLRIKRFAAFSSSQLAPYPGWGAFSARHLDAWEEVERSLGQLRLTRIGTRYINRIDIPGILDEASRWIVIGPAVPPSLPTPLTFSVNTVMSFGSNVQANVGVTIVDPIMPAHSAILLDIDVYWVSQIPDLHDARVEIMNELRDRKNSIFEACITDETRKLIR
jgi:uncharacterized protein (TIGR04255 family)